MKAGNLEYKETYGAIFPDTPTMLHMKTQNHGLDVITLNTDGILEISDELADAIARKLKVGYKNEPNVDYKKIVEDMREWLYEKIKITSKEVIENPDISGDTMNTYVYVKMKLDELINFK